MSTIAHEPQNHHNPFADQQPVTVGQLRWHMEGMRHARLATVFGILGIFTLGALFGPLAMAEAKKAEAFGVPAPEGRVLGWVGIGLFSMGVLFFLAYLAMILAVLAGISHPVQTGV